MARKFADHEKEQIRAKLQEHGRELFSKYGLKKTSIEEITKSVGIAQGSFYLFYSSKEELYFDLLEQEEEDIQRKLASIIGNERPTRQTWSKVLKEAIRLIDENPFIRQIYLENQYELLMRKLPMERLEKHFQKDLAQLPMIRQWQQKGWIIHEQPEVIISLLRALILLTLHKKEMGEYYEETMDLFIRFIVQGLIPGEEQDHD
jgi:AcrR family transcriptional regulator